MLDTSQSLSAREAAEVAAEAEEEAERKHVKARPLGAENDWKRLNFIDFSRLFFSFLEFSKAFKAF